MVEGDIQATIAEFNPYAVAEKGLFDVGQLHIQSTFEEWADIPDAEEIYDLLQYLDEDKKQEALKILLQVQPRPLLPHQIIPWWNPDWTVALLCGGRGVGKTVTGVTAVEQHLDEYGKDARVGIGAPTNSDARDTCMEGVTGLYTMFRHKFPYYNRTLGLARHIKGGFVKFMGTEKPQRWNGPQWSLLWFDELALCNKKAWDDANLGLRLLDKPRAICTTTPKNKRWVRELSEQPTTYVPHYTYIDASGQEQKRFPTTFDNPYLPAERVAWLKQKYLNTRLGRQELLGMFIGDIEGAAWSRGIIHHETDKRHWAPFKRIVVAIDPAGSANRRGADKNVQEAKEESDVKNADTGISVVALGADGRYYVLALLSGQWTPKEWAIKAIQLYHRIGADRIVAESNYGGLMVENTIRTIDEEVMDAKGRMVRIVGKNLPIKLVTASLGKRVRAEPVVALYEQGRVIHCAIFGPGEDQMCAFIDTDENEGADMVDALVWGITELMGPVQTYATRVVGVRTGYAQGPGAFVVR